MDIEIFTPKETHSTIITVNTEQQAENFLDTLEEKYGDATVAFCGFTSQSKKLLDLRNEFFKIVKYSPYFFSGLPVFDQIRVFESLGTDVEIIAAYWDFDNYFDINWSSAGVSTKTWLKGLAKYLPNQSQQVYRIFPDTDKICYYYTTTRDFWILRKA